MKTKIISLAFMLVFAFSTTAFADGETGSGNKSQDPPPATESSSSSSNFLTQIFDAFYSTTY